MACNPRVDPAAVGLYGLARGCGRECRGLVLSLLLSLHLYLSAVGDEGGWDFGFTRGPVGGVIRRGFWGFAFFLRVVGVLWEGDFEDC